MSVLILSEIRTYTTVTYCFLDGTVETEKVYFKKKLKSETEGTSWYSIDEKGYSVQNEITVDNDNYVLHQRYNVKLFFLDEQKEFIFSHEQIEKNNIYSFATVNLQLDNFYYENEYSNLFLDRENNLFFSKIKKQTETKEETPPIDDKTDEGEENSGIIVDDNKNTGNENPTPEPEPAPSTKPKEEEKVSLSIVESATSNLKVNFELTETPVDYDLSLNGGYFNYKIKNGSMKIQDMITLKRDDIVVNYIINISIPINGDFKLNYKNSTFDSYLELSSFKQVEIKAIYSKNNKIIENKIFNCYVEMNLKGSYSGNEHLTGEIDNRIVFYADSSKKIKLIEYVEKYYPKSLNGDIGLKTCIIPRFVTRTCFAVDNSNILKNVQGYYSSDVYSGECIQTLTAKSTILRKIESFSLIYEKK